MCLASKVRVLCGRADSPTLSSRTFRFRELDATARNDGESSATPPAANKLHGVGRAGEVVGASIPKSASHESAFKIPDVPNPNQEV